MLDARLAFVSTARSFANTNMDSHKQRDVTRLTVRINWSFKGVEKSLWILISGSTLWYVLCVSGHIVLIGK